VPEEVPRRSDFSITQVCLQGGVIDLQRSGSACHTVQYMQHEEWEGTGGGLSLGPHPQTKEGAKEWAANVFHRPVPENRNTDVGRALLPMERGAAQDVAGPRLPFADPGPDRELCFPFLTGSSMDSEWNGLRRS